MHKRSSHIIQPHSSFLNTSDDSPPTEFVKFYLILPGDSGQSGPLVGCGDSAVAVWHDRTRTGSPIPNPKEFYAHLG